MSALNRAAQFSPFAALTGFGAEITEAARQTERWIELTEAEKTQLGQQLAGLSTRLPARVRLTWFVQDARKEGGQYVTRDVTLRRVLPTEGRVVLEIKSKYGKNAILKGMNLREGATARERNAQIGGHRA